MYHRFANNDLDTSRRLKASLFNRQLAYICAHHEVWNPDQQLSALDGNPVLTSRPPVVITVDDGYSDFFQIAFPLLKKFSLGAMVFVTTGFISGHCWFWWDRLSYLLASAPAGKRTIGFNQRTAHGDPSDPAERQSLWKAIADHLSTIPDEDKELVLVGLAKKLEVSVPTSPPAEFAPITWDQIREMAAQGIEFGAHTVNHPVLSRVDRQRAEEEIAQSRDELSGQLDREVGWFCYPQGLPGDFLPETVELVQKSGFRGSFTAFPSATHGGFPFTLPRYSISGDEVKFQWIMCGAEFLLMKGRARLAPQTAL